MQNESIWYGRAQCFLIALIGSWLACLAIIHFGHDRNLALGEATALQVKLATAIWAVIFFGLGFKHFVRIPAANTVEIIANPLKKEVVPVPGTFDGHQEIHAQRACRSGPNLTYPWEYQAGKFASNKKLLLEIDKDLYETEDGKYLEVDARVVLTVLPGYEVPRFRYIHGHGDGCEEDGNEALKEYFLGEITSFLQGYMITRQSGYIKTHLDEFKEAFKKQFGGAAIDPREEWTGTWTGEPKLERVEEQKAVRDASVLKSEYDYTKKLYTDILTDGAGTISKEVAWKFALAFSGKIDINFSQEEIIIANAHELPRNLMHLNVGAAGFSGGKGGRKGAGPKPPKGGGGGTPPPP
jgi:hypothetical protein